MREQLKAEGKLKPSKPDKKGLQTHALPAGDLKQHKKARREKRAALQRKSATSAEPDAFPASKSPVSTVRKQDRTKMSKSVAS